MSCHTVMRNENESTVAMHNNVNEFQNPTVEQMKPDTKRVYNCTIQLMFGKRWKTKLINQDGSHNCVWGGGGGCDCLRLGEA